MLRVYFLKLGVQPLRPGGQALYDRASMREWVGIDRGEEGAPDETPVCTFRHLGEAHQRGQELLETVNRDLAKNAVRARLPMRRSSMRRVRPGTGMGRVTRRCAGRPRGSRGLSAGRRLSEWSLGTSSFIE